MVSKGLGNNWVVLYEENVVVLKKHGKYIVMVRLVDTYNVIVVVDNAGYKMFVDNFLTLEKEILLQNLFRAHFNPIVCMSQNTSQSNVLAFVQNNIIFNNQSVYNPDTDERQKRHFLHDKLEYPRHQRLKVT